MDNAKPAVTLIETSNMEALSNRYKYSFEDKNWYARVIELLIYAMLGTCVDIAYSVLFLSRFLGNLGPQYIRTTKRIMQYLCRTTKLKLIFCGNLKPLVGYTDLKWVRDLESCYSTSGYLFNISSGAINWSLKRQLTISLSSL